MYSNNRKSYGSILHAYRRLISKFIKAVRDGSFYSWSEIRRQYSLARLIKLGKKLQVQGMKVATIAGLSFLLSTGLKGQDVLEQCASDPFGNLLLLDNDSDHVRVPVTVDFDEDGDDDLMIMTVFNEDSPNDSVKIQYWQNGPGGLAELMGMNNPFYEFNDIPWQDEPFGSFVFNPTFGDWDLDGDLDLVLGEFFETSIIFFNENNVFEFQGPILTEEFDSEHVFYRFANLDDDCDQEMIQFDVCSNGKGILVYDVVDGEYEQNELNELFIPILDSSLAEDRTNAYFFDLNNDAVDELVIICGKDSPTTIHQIKTFEIQGGHYLPIESQDDPFEDLAINVPAHICDVPELQLYMDFGDLDGDGYLNFYVSDFFGKSDGDDVEDDRMDGFFCYSMEGILSRDLCPEEIPTLGQWGAIILGLCTVILGILSFGFISYRHRKTS